MIRTGPQKKRSTLNALGIKRAFFCFLTLKERGDSDWIIHLGN